MKINTKYNNPSLIPSFSEKLQPTSPIQGSVRRYGRVKRIVLEETNPDYEIFGRTDALYGIRVYLLDSQLDENEIDELPFAKNFDLSLRTVPLLGEIVEVFSAPSQLSPTSTQISTNLYYSRIVNPYNSVNNGFLPDATQTIEDPDLGEEVEELDDIGILFPFPGDTLIQGRTGGNIRISGYSHPKNVYSNGDNNGKPFIILSTEDVPKSEEIPSARVESLNNPGSTVFIGTNHNIFLNSTHKFKETYIENPEIRDNYKPVEFNLYRGSQIGMNTGRIVLQGNEDGVFLIGKKSVGGKGESINLEGTKYIGLDAPKIYIGQKSKIRDKKVNQPAIKGQELVDWEKDLLNELRSIARKFSTVSNPPQAVAVLSQVGNSLLGKINSLESRLERIKSKKVYIE